MDEYATVNMMVSTLSS